MLQPVGLLALCPLIAGGGTLLTATCLALLFLVMLVLVSITMAALGRSVSSEVRILTLFLVSGVWVTLLDLLLQAIAYPLWATLDIYVPLLAANSLLLAAGEQSLRGGSLAGAAREGMSLGVHVTLWLIPMGLMREVLGGGVLLSDVQFVPGMTDSIPISTVALPILQSAPGALLLLALACATAATVTKRNAGRA